MNAFTHQLFDFLRLVGLRDRLRCPRCRAVGTWKPHGGWLDFEDERKVRRWLCKWCGHYRGPVEDEPFAPRWATRTAGIGERAWELGKGRTTRSLLKQALKGREINPWGG